eukprot:5497131-Pleurochrysis_carterae.AAC.2
MPPMLPRCQLHDRKLSTLARKREVARACGRPFRIEAHTPSFLFTLKFGAATSPDALAPIIQRSKWLPCEKVQADMLVETTSSREIAPRAQRRRARMAEQLLRSSSRACSRRSRLVRRQPRLKH